MTQYVTWAVLSFPLSLWTADHSSPRLKVLDAGKCFVGSFSPPAVMALFYFCYFFFVTLAGGNHFRPCSLPAPNPNRLPATTRPTWRSATGCFWRNVAIPSRSECVVAIYCRLYFSSEWVSVVVNKPFSSSGVTWFDVQPVNRFSWPRNPNVLAARILTTYVPKIPSDWLLTEFRSDFMWIR